MAAAGLAALSRRLGHVFAEPGLLKEALTHPSLETARRGGRDYDRLEFLGDRVLGLVVSSRLHRHYPKADAGELAVRHNALVRKETVADVARELGLGRHLRLSRSEEEGGGRDKAAILANACEAIIAALYLDGGLEAAAGFIDRYWSARLEAGGEAVKDPKTRLQEWAQRGAKPPPTYRIVAQSGPPHDPTFTVEVSLPGLRPVTAEGKSRRAAEQAVAAALLVDLELDEQPDRAREA